MKQFENIFRTIFWAVTLFFFTTAPVNNIHADELSRMDSVEIGLITCSPHEEIYSLYGHTALRYHDLQTGTDVVFNYGVFNFKAPHFILRFVFGLTDYELGVAPTQPFLEYYAEWGSGVMEQVLNLTAKEKLDIANALDSNYMAENRVYRYNFFYDNCSTRPRDLVERHVDGNIEYNPRTDYAPTQREMIHAYSAGHPWATFGNDILLGVRADHPTTMREQEFLPDNLRYDFDHAFIVKDGVKRPLVKERRELLKHGIQVVERGFPLTPTLCGIILLVVSLIVFVYEVARKTTLRVFDLLLMLSTGLAGLILFVMVFSKHPATSLNLQILIFNPLSLFFLWPVWKKRKTVWFKCSLFFTLLFFLGSIWQDYAEGMEFVALSLLSRYWIHCHDK